MYRGACERIKGGEKSERVAASEDFRQKMKTDEKESSPDAALEKTGGETNYLILTDSGKPIFARYGSDEQVGQICGMISGLRSSILFDSDLQLGEVQSMESQTFKLALWQVNGLLLVAIVAQPAVGGTDAYLRFVLETLYAQLCFSLTKPTLDSTMVHPNYDMSSAMGTTVRQLHSILDQMDLHASDDTGNLSLGLIHSLGGSLQPLHPFSSAIRDQVSIALREITTPNTLFSFLLAGNGRLVSLVQSNIRTMQMRAFDWSLLFHFLQQQAELLTSELWLPVCLPRFNVTGYVFCYTRCLDANTGLCVGLISHIGTTKQFQAFQSVSSQLCARLCIKMSSVRNKDNPSNPPSPEVTNNLFDKEELMDDNGSDDYVVVTAHGIVEEVAMAQDHTILRKIHGEYLELCEAFHFVFRFDVPLPRKFRQPPGRLPQCICASDEDLFQTSASRRKLWSNYDKLMMRLRLGSAQSESVQDALEMIYNDRRSPSKDSRRTDNAVSEPPPHAALDYECNASALLEAAPQFASMTAIVEGDYLYAGINGDAFELYFTLSADLSVKQATALGAKLVRRLLLEQQQLFLWNPLVWK